MLLQWHFEKSTPDVWYWTRTDGEDRAKGGPFSSFAECVIDAQHNGLYRAENYKRG